MSAQPQAGRVLVVGDGNGDAEMVAQTLGDDFAEVLASGLPAEHVADFDRLQPHVMVLAFRSLGKARQCCLGLMRPSAVARSQLHRTIVLCSKEDAREAYELCKQESFDDYVQFWPQAYDGKRLAMSVWIACRELAARRTGGPSHTEVSAHASRSEAMEPTVDAQIAEGERRAAREPCEGGRPIAAGAGQFGAELAERVRLPRPLVVVVEDDAFAARLVAKALAPQAWDVEFAGDADSAQALLRRARPSLILMDVNLPGMDGLALTELLKATPAFADIPVLMLTGEARRETLERSRSAGAAGFIVKPFTRDGLIAKIAPFLA